VAAGIDPAAVAEKGAASYLQQLWRFGFFHADPHPGNLALAADGGLIYYDFGMMGQISPRLRSRIGRMVRAAAGRDASALVVELQGAGVIAAGIDAGPVAPSGAGDAERRPHPPFSANVLEKLSGDLYDLVYGQPFRLPSELIFVMRALSTFEGVGRGLDPGFSLISIARPYLLPLMTASGQGPNDFINELGRQAGELGSRALGIPRRLDDSLAAHRTRRPSGTDPRRRNRPPPPPPGHRPAGQRSVLPARRPGHRSSPPGLQRPPSPHGRAASSWRARGPHLAEAPGQTATRWPHR